MRKSNWISLAIAMCIAALVAVLEQQRGYYFLNAKIEPETATRPALFMQKGEWFTYDTRIKFESKRPPHPDIALIGIDDQSLKHLHQWPWPRSIHARLIRKLAKAHPKAMAFDIFFVDPFTSDPGGDRDLVEATRSHPWVIHSLYGDVEGHHVKSVVWPFPALRSAAHALGYVNAFVDEDGVLRTAVPQMILEGRQTYLLSVLAASQYIGKDPDVLLQAIPTDPHGQFLVHFIGSKTQFPIAPYETILAASENDLIPIFRDKIILVGSFATGTYDHYPMPNSKNAAGVLFHANIIDNLLRRNALRYVGLRWTYAMIAFFGLLCGLLIVRFSAWVGAVSVLLLAGLFWSAAQGLFTMKNILVDVAGPLLTLGAGYVATVIYRFFTEEREKRMVKGFFSQQVSSELLKVLMDNPNVLKKAGERREMTALFSDVAGFTSISERLEPESLVELLNRYLTAMTEVIFEYGGYVDKYMGDGIMVFWNGLLKQPNHAEQACRCALKSMRRLKELNEELKSRGLVPLSARIGINTGVMAAGYMGSSQKKQYTIMGDNVNLASRLEGANKAFGSSIMISEFTCDAVTDLFEMRFLDIIRVPGKAKPVKTYELLGEKGSVNGVWGQVLPVYHQAIQEFGSQQFESARAKFLEVLRILGHDKPCETYIQRAEAFIESPPPKDWDGVFELKTK